MNGDTAERCWVWVCVSVWREGDSGDGGGGQGGVKNNNGIRLPFLGPLSWCLQVSPLYLHTALFDHLYSICKPLAVCVCVCVLMPLELVNFSIFLTNTRHRLFPILQLTHLSSV